MTHPHFTDEEKRSQELCLTEADFKPWLFGLSLQAPTLYLTASHSVSSQTCVSLANNFNL